MIKQEIWKKGILSLGIFFIGMTSIYAQFVHPGLTNKKSDLDRVKYMFEAQIDPWYSSYQEMASDSKSSYNYSVQGDASFTELGRDSGVNYRAWNNDIRAAYYNSIRWYVTGDTRHAEKAVEIFNSWKNLRNVTSGGTQALSAGVGYIMIEAAEIIKSTYSGWSTSDIQDFKDMLVYPGYSNTAAPLGDKTFYWMGYQGDAIRHGNQGLSGFRTVMAIGIFNDNEIIYDRALRNIQGLPHRSDDFPYPAGGNTSNSRIATGTFADTWDVTRGYANEDYGYDEVMTNYIYENGQCQESSRDQQHTMYGIGNLTSMAEMAWNQGDDLYSHANDRLLLGLEYNMRYNVSSIRSYPDQTSTWTPTLASGEFLEGFDRTGRWFSKAMSDIGAGDFSNTRPVFEMPVAHYYGRGFKTADEVKWITRARDIAIEISGYEVAGWTNDAIGWGAITSRRPAYCYGDPISGFDSNGLPDYNMNVLPMTIEAENFDYSPVLGEGRTYNDTSNGNSGNEYRNDENVDIQVRTGGGYNVGWITSGEWLTYTVYVPETGTYDISVNYAATNSTGKIKFEFGGNDKTGEVNLASTGGTQIWETLTIAEGVLLPQGVQSLKVSFSGGDNVMNLNNFTVSNSSLCAASSPFSDNNFLQEITYNYYEGTWNNIPDFDVETIVNSGISPTIGLGNGERADSFGYRFDGYVNILTEGDYTFYTKSDDGSNLFIDGVKLLNNDGTHGATEVSGDICLQSGYHEIRVEYFDKSGASDVLEVSYEGPGISKIGITDLYHLDEGTLGINTIENEFPGVSFYPNPVKDILNVKFNKTETAEVSILNLAGQKVYSGVLKNGANTIQLGGLSTGMYIMKIVDEVDVYVQKIIVEK